MRASSYAYPAANIAHLLGLALAFGGVIVLDLRMLGAGRDFSADAVSRALSPLIALGFALLAASGIVMAVTDARALAASPAFQWKFALIGLALLNALAFRRWGGADARIPALASLVPWTGVVAAGRLIGYL